VNAKELSLLEAEEVGRCLQPTSCQRNRVVANDGGSTRQRVARLWGITAVPAVNPGYASCVIPGSLMGKGLDLPY